MLNVECRIVGFADEEFINKEFIQHSTLRLCRDHSTLNIQHLLHFIILGEYN